MLSVLLWAPATHADSERFEAYLDGVVEASFSEHTLAGMTFVLVQGDAVTLRKGYGYADLESLTPVDPNTHMFRPGSVSKLFTWTAVMQLVEAGKLDLHADLGQYVSQFELPNHFDTPLTMAHLMTHTPGLEDGALGYLFGDSADDHLPLAEVLEAYMPTQVRKPGEYAAYSNWATALAGLVVANVSGMTFEDYIRERIFEPLDMQFSTFDEPLPAELETHMATGYIKKAGRLQPFGFEYIKNFGPAGAMSGSADDMAHFMIAHLNEGRFGATQLLQPDTVATMHTRLASHTPDVAGMAHGFIESFQNDQRFIGHAGDTIAFHSQLLLDPSRRWGIYLSFNAPEGAAARNAIVDGIVNYFYPKPTPTYAYERLEGTAARIAEVAGTYRFNRRSFTKLEAVNAMFADLNAAPGPDDTLILQSQEARAMVEIEPYIFQAIGSQDTVQFTRDAQGEVTHLLIASLPIVAADRVGTMAAGNTHQIIILLAALASLFLVINYVRNRKDGLEGHPARARLLLTLAGVSFVLFALALAMLVGSVGTNTLLFDFPLPGTGLVMSLAVLAAMLTALSIAHLPLVWGSSACNRWAALRYTYVCLIFALLVYVLHFWNLLGWNYY
ncbi:MAG: serine hydrolase domain-containing protein [Pseudomonadota bacterium]